jgi:cytochrome c
MRPKMTVAIAALGMLMLLTGCGGGGDSTASEEGSNENATTAPNGDTSSSSSIVFTGKLQTSPIVEGETFRATGITVTGAQRPNLNWQYSRDNGVSYQNIEGAVGTTLSLTPAASTSGYLIRLAASTGAESKQSEPAMVVVYLKSTVNSKTASTYYLGQTMQMDATNNSARFPATNSIVWSLAFSPEVSKAGISRDSNAYRAFLVADTPGSYVVKAVGQAGDSFLWEQYFYFQVKPSNAGPDTPISADPRVLAEQRGCLACHGVDKKIVGPSFLSVAQRYAGDVGAEQALAVRVKQGGSGVWGSIPMPSSNVTDVEAGLLVRWILSM